jgi:hypothetical protein
MSDGLVYDLDFWRTRAAELQQALDSRVTVEQAKGVLAERYDCDVDAAFALLRSASRSHRVSLHRLAAQVRPGSPTPPEILAALARTPLRSPAG